jgi:hypothetical protein
MRSKRAVGVAGAGLGALALAAAAVAQSASGSYDLSWRALNGGGTVTGGGYSAQTAMGQAMAGTSGGGSYAISSGFLASGGDKYKRYLPTLSKDGSN